MQRAKVQFEILKVPGSEQKVFFSFKKKAGDAILFYDQARIYLDALSLYNNATLEEGEAQ